MENKKCYTCGSDEIVLDDSTFESQLVCTSCGTVLQECSSLSTVNTAGTSYMSNDGTNAHMPIDLLKRNLNHKTVAPGKKQGLEMISQFANVFNFSENMQERAKDLFSHAYIKEFRKESILKKLILAASCVYAVMKENGREVVFEDLFKYLGCTPKQFFSIYRRFEKNSNLKFPQQTIDDFVISVLRDVELDDSKLKISKKTVEILKVCYECWVSSGRSRRHVVIAATYVAWVSSDYSRCKVKFSDFYSRFSFSKEMYRTAAQRVQDIYSVFIKHAKHLPWLKKASDVNDKNIFLHVDHVLKYFKGLHDSVLSETGASNWDADIVQYTTLRPESRKRKQCHEVLDPGSNLQNPDGTCNDYISDTEIDNYIRTKTEVAKYCKLMDSIRATRDNSETSAGDGGNTSDTGKEAHTSDIENEDGD